MKLENLLEKDAHYSQQLAIPENRKILHHIASFVAHSGDSWFWGAGLGILWLFGPQTWRSHINIYFLGIFITALVVMGLKFTIQRPRPASNWGDMYRKTDPHSFPSGHAARASMLAVLGVGLGPAWLGILLVTWAPLVGVARIALGVHYISDIVVGMMVGVIFGVAVLSLIV